MINANRSPPWKILVFCQYRIRKYWRSPMNRRSPWKNTEAKKNRRYISWNSNNGNWTGTGNFWKTFSPNIRFCHLLGRFSTLLTFEPGMSWICYINKSNIHFGFLVLLCSTYMTMTVHHTVCKVSISASTGHSHGSSWMTLLRMWAFVFYAGRLWS